MREPELFADKSNRLSIGSVRYLHTLVHALKGRTNSEGRITEKCQDTCALARPGHLIRLWPRNLRGVPSANIFPPRSLDGTGNRAVARCRLDHFGLDKNTEVGERRQRR